MNTRTVRTVVLGLFLAGLTGQLHAAGSPLENNLKAINKDLKTLKAQLDDPAKNESSLQLAADLKEKATAARDLEPTKVQEASGAEKTRLLADYKAALGQFIAGVNKLDKALRANVQDEAKSLLKELTKQKRLINSTYLKKTKSPKSTR